MRPNLEDFTSKYGFREGSALEDRDFRARDRLISEINKKSKEIRAVAWDRGGLHNPCMLVFFERRNGWKPSQYITAWHKNEIIPAPPGVPGMDLGQLISDVYEWQLDGLD